MEKIVSIACLLLVISASVDSAPKWDGLKTTWSANVWSHFNSQPRTVKEAKEQGFKPVGSDQCGDSKRYNGRAYVKDGDYAVTLLYDINGFIAGIQAGISNEEVAKTKYPSNFIRPPWVPDGSDNNRMIVTAYFIEPTKICEEGRTLDEFHAEGTGTGLWLQTGENPNEVTRIATTEEDVGSPWVKGKCFYTMGNHYWYNITENMSCERFQPYFLLYNGGQLNAFGWAMTSNLTSDHYEHPGSMVYPLFMETVPKCLLSAGTISTMHVYLTSNPVTGDFC